MKKLSLIVVVAIVTTATLMLQGCKNEANPAEERNAEATERVAEATERVAEATERLAEATERMIPQSITDRESGSTIGWPSLSLAERQEVLDAVGVNSAHHYDDPIRPNPPIQSVTFVLYLTDVPSPAEEQTLLEYEYVDARGVTGENMILVQGHIKTGDTYVPIESIPYVLNANECCFHYGGCINGTICSGQRPRAEKCVPCQQKAEPCLPCQQQGTPGPSRRQGDGAAPSQTSNGRSRVLPPVDL